MQEEMFTGENQYSLDGRKIDAVKTCHIEVAPKVLILQLKRFEYDCKTWERHKVNER
jgi:ubiquitin C-terminal hydrolase